jgi:uncharacterized damage-inducible protein DinB
MKETERIIQLSQNLFNGNPWLDITLLGTLQNITAEQAVKKPFSLNSIWETTNHLIHWRRNVLQRVQGQTTISPEHNYFFPITDTTDDAWHDTLKELEASQLEWTDFLKSMQDEDLRNIYPINGHSHYEHIHGIIQHDAYHLGQIVLISKHLI